MRCSHQYNKAKAWKSLISGPPNLADAFSCLWNRSEREMECLAHQEGSEKRGESGVNYLNTITASNNCHPSLASSLSTVATIPSPHLDFLSRQIGQTLCHPREPPPPPFTSSKPEQHSLTTFARFSVVLLLLFSITCFSLRPPLAGGKLPLTITPQEGYES